MVDWFPADGSTLTVVLLGAAAFFAGFVDAIVGGGGLIQVPALFALFPNTPAPLLLGTNKLSSICGTSVAAVQYARRTRVEWRAALPAAGMALVMSFAGAWTVSRVPSDVLRAMLPLILIGLAVYTFLKRDFGQLHAPAHTGARELLLGSLLGAAVGFYDGFLGPGTGSFLIFLFIRFFGFDFLSASAAAKVVNVACNLGALLLFAQAGQIWVGLGLVMAGCNISGSLVGSSLALKHGSGFVRKLFLVVVSALILQTAYQAWFR